ncbi:hypothetical protein ACP70R_049241 [Stipagrostis hirtigluma subsp. patula]
MRQRLDPASHASDTVAPATLVCAAAMLVGRFPSSCPICDDRALGGASSNRRGGTALRRIGAAAGRWAMEAPRSERSPQGWSRILQPLRRG